jgi:hypothetical protein
MAVPLFTTLIVPVKDTVDQSAYTTDSIAPTANRLLFLAVCQKHASTDQAAPTVSGGGVATWTQVGTVNDGGRRRLTVFRALTGASPSSGEITITMAATMGSAAWHVVEVADCLLTGTNGADALPQAVVTDSDLTGALSVLTLGSAWADADSRGLSFFYGSSGSSGITWTPTEAGFTSLGSFSSGTGDNAGNYAALHGRNGTVLELGASSSQTDIRVALGFEVAGAGDEAATPVTFDYPRVRQTGLNGRLN